MALAYRSSSTQPPAVCCAYHQHGVDLLQLQRARNHSRNALARVLGAGAGGTRLAHYDEAMRAGLIALTAQGLPPAVHPAGSALRIGAGPVQCHRASSRGLRGCGASGVGPGLSARSTIRRRRRAAERPARLVPPPAAHGGSQLGAATINPVGL